jgi:metalloendopeptidase OMA1, mitochondrial
VRRAFFRAGNISGALFTILIMRPRRRSLTILPLLLAVAFALFQYFGAERITNPETGRAARVAMSPREEAQLGLQSFQEIVSESDLVQSGPEFEMVKQVAARLARAVGDVGENFDWQVVLIRSDQANAFCLPGGKIAVYTGILPHTQSEAGLAAVMGHEMAHAIARHGSQRLLQNSLTQTIMVGAQLSFSDLDVEQRRMVMAALGAGAQYGVLLPFSRSHETEADEMGLLYMARAGYDPTEAIGFWQRMNEAGGQKPPEFMSTHPANETRIENLRALLPRAQAEFTNARRE